LLRQQSAPAPGAVGIIKAVSNTKEAAATKQWQESTMVQLKAVAIQLNALQPSANPDLRKQLAQATDRINAVATSARGSNFSASFSATEFRLGISPMLI
jgi:hypothetical protein